MSERYSSAEWLELAGLPVELNAKVRSGAWVVFKKIVELDCGRNRDPGAVEISLDELGERCGLDWEKIARIIEALRKRKVLACFLPDNPDERKPEKFTFEKQIDLLDYCWRTTCTVVRCIEGTLPPVYELAMLGREPSRWEWLIGE